MTGTHSQNRLLGYARVSTYGQTLDAQLEQLRADGCSRIYHEKVTGARADRRELLKLLESLAPGHVVTVTRIEPWRAAPSTCSPSSSRSWTPRRNSAPSPSRGPTPGTSTGRLMIALLGGLTAVERDLSAPARRRPQPGEEARAAHGPAAETHRHAEGRGPSATRRGRDARRTHAQLRR
jgi:hypothetical protein